MCTRACVCVFVRERDAPLRTEADARYIVLRGTSFASMTTLIVFIACLFIACAATQIHEVDFDPVNVEDFAKTLTPLNLAVARNDPEQIRDVLSDPEVAKELLNKPHEKTGQTPLMSACLAGHLEAVKTLFEFGADPTIGEG